MQYSLRSEKACVYRIRYVIRFHKLRHPMKTGVVDIKESFLPCLANNRHVSASTHQQALCALPFLYKQVLETGFPWPDDVYRPNRPPAVLTG